MKKIIITLITLALGLGFSATASAVEEVDGGAALMTSDTLLISEDLEEAVDAEDEEGEEEEGESIWNQTTITCFLVATIAIILILNLMQLRRK